MKRVAIVGQPQTFTIEFDEAHGGEVYHVSITIERPDGLTVAEYIDIKFRDPIPNNRVVFDGNKFKKDDGFYKIGTQPQWLNVLSTPAPKRLWPRLIWAKLRGKR